jgi:hypothetical protein
VTITIPTGVTVYLSAGANITSTANPVIRLNGNQSGLVCALGNTATVTNTGTGDTILIQGPAAIISDVDVADCKIVGSDTAARGIVALRGTKINIRGNHLTGHKSDGIVVDGDGVGGATQNLIKGNRVTASGSVLANKAGIRVGSTNVNTTTRIQDNYSDNWPFGLSDAGTNTESIGNVWETPTVAGVSIETGSTDFLSLHDWYEGFPVGHAGNIHSNDRTRILYPHTVTALSDFTFDSFGAVIDRFELKIQGQAWSGPTCFLQSGGDISLCPTGSAISSSGTVTFTGPFSAKFTGPAPWIDVTNSTYGATGNGVTDDAAAIQAALNALPSPGGGKIFFPCGNYLVKSTLTIPLNTDADITGEGQGCAKIIKDFDSTSLFRSANSNYGTQTTLTANANLGDQRLTVTSSAGFVAGNWIQLDDNTGVTTGVNCLSYTGYEPAALSCNLGIYRIRSIPDGTHIDITTSLDEPYTTAGLARVSAITIFTANFHDLYFAHGPDCGIANSCTGRMIDLIFPVEVELKNLTMDVGNTIAVVQFHRGKHIKYHDCVIRNGADSLTKNGLGANTVIFDEASSYWEFGPNNNMYKAGETVAQGQSHHGEFHHNTFNGCADSCINTHGNKDHDISMSYNVMGGGSTSDTQNTVSARCIIVSDTDFNINVDNNVCRNWSQTGIQVVATTQFSISNISIRDNQIFTPITSTGVFPPNYFLSTTTNPPIGINVQGVDNPKILGNTISGAFPANSLGIQVASSRRPMLIGNHVTQTATVAGDIGIYHITNAAQPSTQMMLVGNIVTGWNSSNCRFDLGASTFAGLTLVGNDCSVGPGTAYVYGASITGILRAHNVGDTAAVAAGTLFGTQTIASGTAAMTTAGIGTGACGTTVTVAATGVLTTDTIDFARNAAATIGNGGGLALNAWPTAGNVNFNYCNSSAGTITPTAMTVNWSVRRP